jgi:hypothetical protein
MEVTWDAFILLIFGAFVVYGAFISKNRILGVLINLYIAIAITLLAGDTIFNIASNIPLITNNVALTRFGTLTLTLILAAGLLTIKSELSDLDSGDSLSKVTAGTYGFLTAGLLLSAIFGFMGQTQLVNLDSNFALIVINFTPAFAVAPVLIMIASAFTKRGKKKR